MLFLNIMKVTIDGLLGDRIGDLNSIIGTSPEYRQKTIFKYFSSSYFEMFGYTTDIRSDTRGPWSGM